MQLVSVVLRFLTAGGLVLAPANLLPDMASQGMMGSTHAGAGMYVTCSMYINSCSMCGFVVVVSVALLGQHLAPYLVFSRQLGKYKGG
jgi:hypothetical protein